MIVSQNFRTTKLNKHNVILITNINFSNCCVLILLVLVANLFRPVAASKNSIHYNYNYKVVNQLVRVIYQAGVSLVNVSVVLIALGLGLSLTKHI